MKVLLFALPCLVASFSATRSPLFVTRTAAPKLQFSSTSLDAATNGANGDASKKKVIVLGGDGFCGWPTSLYLSDQGHDIVIVDNLSRRNIDTELGCDSLTPIKSPEVSQVKFILFRAIIILSYWRLEPVEARVSFLTVHAHFDTTTGARAGVEGGDGQGYQVCEPRCGQGL
jgi:hypothetical protein